MDISETLPSGGNKETSEPLLPPDQHGDNEYPSKQMYPDIPTYPPPQYGAPVVHYNHGPPFPGYHVVTMQPTVNVTYPPLLEPLPDYLCYSVFTMMCCCLPLGIAALVYSISTRNANMSGQPQMAERSSKMALTLNHVALGIGLTFIVLYIVLINVTAH